MDMMIRNLRLMERERELKVQGNGAGRLKDRGTEVLESLRTRTNNKVNIKRRIKATMNIKRRTRRRRQVPTKKTKSQRATAKQNHLDKIPFKSPKRHLTKPADLATHTISSSSSITIQEPIDLMPRAFHLCKSTSNRIFRDSKSKRCHVIASS